MKIGLVGPSYQMRSLPFDCQRSINCEPVFDQQGKEVAALYGTVGKDLFATCGDGPVRGGFVSANGRAFVVSGISLYEIDESGTPTDLGDLNTSSGNVTMDENTTQLAVCDGNDLYILTYSTDAFAQVTDGDFPATVGTVTAIDGYFVVNQVDTGKFYISSLNDGTAWDALDFATAESSPDVLKRVIRAIGQLWLMGGKTIEPWTNTGDSSFPFRPISGAQMAKGIMAPHTAQEFGNSLMWVGQDDLGSGVVYRAKGFTPQRVSTEAIEKRIREATDKENMRSLCYQMEGHEYYMLTGGGLETSLVFDLTTELWHERAYLDDGEFAQDRANCFIFAFDKHLVGDRVNGKIYELDPAVYDDNGDALVFDRIFTHISNENERIRFNKLVLGVETGVGLQSGQGSAPIIMARFSKDGGRTWTDWREASMGGAGEYETEVCFRRIGIAKQLTINVRITDPVKRVIVGAYLT